ncbi:MAG: metal-binding protein [Clostridiales bacterium]|nr:metal-binding protein [Clostridiales bacterium]
MRQITQQQILALAPNSTAALNGQKISQKGGFVRLECSADDTFYLGECTGSGKSNYITTADFIDPNNPVFRCSCPSRQFPCKHSLALLYEIMAQKKFNICEIPEDILQKREKKMARDAKANAPESDTETKKKSPSKASQAAKSKKIKMQLEGLELTAKLTSDLVRSGLGTMGGASLDTYRQLSKQLGDYYLPGPQRLLNRLILEIEAFQKDSSESHYDSAIAVLEELYALVKKSTQYLSAKLESGEVAQDDNLLYEKLGGVWKLSELSALGLSRQNVHLIQLSFYITYDEAAKEYVDTGVWLDLDSGEISLTQNYRPIKALKYVKQDDSIFGVADIDEAVWYPGDGNRRVRWDGAAIRAVEQSDIDKIRSLAPANFTEQVKAAKNYLKNSLSDDLLIGLIPYTQIGRVGDDKYALKTDSGDTIMLGDAPNLEASVQNLSILPSTELLFNNILCGAYYYDAANRRLCVQPLSIITSDRIVRLLY